VLIFSVVYVTEKTNGKESSEKLVF